MQMVHHAALRSCTITASNASRNEHLLQHGLNLYSSACDLVVLQKESRAVEHNSISAGHRRSRNR